MQIGEGHGMYFIRGAFDTSPLGAAEGKTRISSIMLKRHFSAGHADHFAGHELRIGGGQEYESGR